MIGSALGLALGLYEAGWLADENFVWLATLAARVLRANAGGGLNSLAWRFDAGLHTDLWLQAAGYAGIDEMLATLQADPCRRRVDREQAWRRAMSCPAPKGAPWPDNEAAQ